MKPYSTQGGKPEWKRPLGKPRSKWEDNIRMDLRKIEWEVVNWIHLVQDRDQWRTVVNMTMQFWVSLKAENFLTS
jgi:hypothetical protein